MKHIQFCLMVFALALIASGMAHAQATRTWVSGVGDDANPCSRTAPCKTFAGAISKTATSGEINVLDPGGFGALTITKSITIDGGSGNIAGVLVSGTNGITVAVTAGSVVTLRNLDIDGIGTGLNGIQFTGGGTLHVEHCIIYGFTDNGINIGTNSASQVSIVDTIVRDNTLNGLLVQNTVAQTSVLVSGSDFDNNAQNGIWASDFSKVTVTNSEVSAYGNVGVLAESNNGTATINIINSTVVGNQVAGIQAGGGTTPAFVRATGVSLFNGAAGFLVEANGTIQSFGNNYNANPGAPNATIAPQ